MRGMDNIFLTYHWVKIMSVWKYKEKITVAIPAPVSGLTQWIRALVTLGENTFQNLQTLQPKNEMIS